MTSNTNFLIENNEKQITIKKKKQQQLSIFCIMSCFKHTFDVFLQQHTKLLIVQMTEM